MVGYKKLATRGVHNARPLKIEQKFKIIIIIMYDLHIAIARHYSIV